MNEISESSENDGNRRRIRRMGEEGDRISSLPDPLLITILSLMPIESAAATSILSHRWHHLWTGVTRLVTAVKSPDVAETVQHIVRKLTSPKITVLSLSSKRPFYGRLKSKSIFGLLSLRNVVEIKVTIDGAFLFVPACVFQCETLVVLELEARELDCEMPENEPIRLPNLKKLRLHVDDFLRRTSRHMMKTLFKSCPLLEDLYLVFYWENAENYVDIFAPNLKSLYIEMVNFREDCKIVIDAPKLDKIMTFDWSSYLYFVNNPTMLVNASISSYVGDRGVDYMGQLSKFVRGMSSVSSLYLELGRINIYHYLKSEDHGVLPIFRNLVRLRKSLYAFHSWNDFLFCLQCFPNLEHLELRMEDDIREMRRDWCRLDSVPDGLFRKVKTIKIQNLDVNDNEVKLLGFILRNATVLEELWVNSCQSLRIDRRSGALLSKERKFCQALFKLSMSYSTCKVVFRGVFVNASTNDLKNGEIPSQVCYFDSIED